MTNVFQAKFMKSFEGPVSRQLFIDRGDKVQLAFAMCVDFFNPDGSIKWGNHNSIGIISLANLKLPKAICYQLQHIYMAGIIPGPCEPVFEEINHFTQPIIDKLEVGWNRGIHISRTASCPSGHDIKSALVISVNDLPAAHKASGTAGTGSHFYCTVCGGYDHSNLYNTDLNKWTPRDVAEMWQQPEAW
jgi:hypothetical protein